VARRSVSARSLSLGRLSVSEKMSDEELERLIAELVKRKQSLPFDSAARDFVQRQLNGLRYTYEMAGPIWEELDPFGWGATPP